MLLATVAVPEGVGEVKVVVDNALERDAFAVKRVALEDVEQEIERVAEELVALSRSSSPQGGSPSERMRMPERASSLQNWRS